MREREREVDWMPPTCPDGGLNRGDGTQELGVCPDQV